MIKSNPTLIQINFNVELNSKLLTRIDFFLFLNYIFLIEPATILHYTLFFLLTVTDLILREFIEY